MLPFRTFRALGCLLLVGVPWNAGGRVLMSCLWGMFLLLEDLGRAAAVRSKHGSRVWSGAGGGDRALPAWLLLQQLDWEVQGVAPPPAWFLAPFSESPSPGFGAALAFGFLLAFASAATIFGTANHTSVPQFKRISAFLGVPFVFESTSLPLALKR